MTVIIYFNDKPLYLCDALSSETAAFQHQENVVVMQELSDAAVQSMIRQMQLPGVRAGIFIHPHTAVLKDAFRKQFTIIQAAGGLVINEKKEILVMFRRGKWDLPKGKLDAGETLEACAVREVEEETGLQKVQLRQHLLTTYHTYPESRKMVLKESAWYAMQSDSRQLLVPQTNEDIMEVKWIAADQLQQVLANTYPSIKDVLEKGRPLFAG